MFMKELNLKQLNTSSIMKKLSQLKFIVILICFATVFTCSKSDDNTNENPSGQSYINYEVPVNQLVPGGNSFSISSGDDDQAAITIAAHIYDEMTIEGTQKVLSLIFSKYVSDDDYYDVSMTLEAKTGSTVLGEFQTGSTGLITYHPTFNLVMNFDPNRAFYDNNNDGNSDTLTSYLSKNIVVSVTEYEETVNDLGILTVSHVKGKIISGNQVFFKAYKGPTSDPEEVIRNISNLEFEYNLPMQ